MNQFLPLRVLSVLVALMLVVEPMTAAADEIPPPPKKVAEPPGPAKNDVQDAIEAVLQGLARDLHKRGGLDLSECFLDGSFSAAKNGALKLAITSGARAAKSWPLETLMVFQSPSTQKLLRPPK